MDNLALDRGLDQGLNHPMMETNVDGVEVRGQNSVQEMGGSTLSFHEIYYTVQAKNPNKICTCRTAPKQILTDISGILKPGMNAIMGPTGSGKTSLLDILAGRKDSNGLSGSVLIDGRKQPRNFKNMSGYVVQDDIVMGSMTVRENLMFSANMRLPKTVSNDEKNKRVNQAIEELGLKDCQNTRVGSTLIRGVSGGERKRTMIGMELVVSPQLLFLDEPTTGLDANTAYSLMVLLRGLSTRGRTIIFAIHQPRYAIFKLFDQLLLIDQGSMVYQGPAAQALDFFSSIGYECEPHDNPPDFFLDVINGLHGGRTSPRTTTDQFQMSPSGNSATTSSPDVVEAGRGPCENPHELADQFERSKWYKEGLKETLKYLRVKHEEYLNGIDHPEPDYATSFPVQMMYLSKRTLINLYRFPLAALIQWSVSIMFAILTGAVYFHLDKSFPSGVQNRIGAFFFLATNLTFACTAVLELFINERTIFVHENVSGYYRVSSYFLAKVFCDIIPMRVIPMIPVAFISYYMFGLDNDIYKLLFYLLTITMTSCCGAALCFLVSGRFNSVGIATLVTYLIFVVMMAFAGVLMNVSDMAVWLRWLQYFSIMSYCVKALTINEMNGMEFCGDATVSGITFPYCYKGTDWLELQGVAYETTWDLWQNIFGLFMLFIKLLILAYIQLRRLKKLT